jgi:hypothetical protein
MADIDKKLSEVTAATLPLAGTELAYLVQGGAERRTTAEAIAGTLPDATTSTAGKLSAADKTRLDQLGADDSPTFAGLTITGTNPVVIPHLHGALAGPVYEHVRNVSGSTMAALTPYHIVGSQGDTDRVQIIPADATNPSSMPASGILVTALANNEDGHGVIAGVSTGLNTVANPSSTVLYVGTGVLTPTAPAANVQAIAIVGRSHATTGTLAIIGGTSLARVAHTGAYGDLSGRPTLGSAAALNVGTTAGTVAAGDAPAAAITALKAEANPLPQYLQPAEIVAGTNMSVDTTTTPGSVIISTTGSGATPAGTATEIQYRNAGALGAIPNSAVDGTTGAVTLARLLLTANGAASASPLALTGTWFTGGTGATTFPQLLISPTGATLPTLNTAGTGAIINAPSGFTGDLLWLGVNGTRTIGINSALGITTNIGGGANITFTNASTGQDYLTINTSQVILRRDIILAWSNSSTTATADDLRLLRDAAHTLAQRSGSNAQTTRIYNTFTSATNFERAKIEWASNILRIGTEKGSGGGTARDMELQTDGTTRITIRANGAIIFAGLPTTNPAVTGQLWNDGGTLKISA